MEEKLVKILREFKKIEPDYDFKERLRLKIAERESKTSLTILVKREFLENLKFGFTLVFTSIIILIIFGGLTFWQKITDEKLSTFNGAELLAEVDHLDFQIRLGEARYFTESANEVAVILGEIKNPNHELIAEALNAIIF